MPAPAHKFVGGGAKPGQITNPVNTDMADDMGQYAAPYQIDVAPGIRYGGAPMGSIDTSGLTRRGNPLMGTEQKAARGMLDTVAKRVAWRDDFQARHTDRARSAIRAALVAGADLDTILKGL